jgi:hypothetical protein
VVDLEDKRDAVGVLARHHAEHPQGAGDALAAGFDGELHDALGFWDSSAKKLFSWWRCFFSD